MPKVISREPTQEDINYIGTNMRDMDVISCRLLSRMSPYECLQRGLEESEYIITIDVGNTPSAMIGFRRIGRSACMPWMLTTEDVKKNSMSVARVTKRFVDTSILHFDHAFNIVMLGDVYAVKLIKFLGFTLTGRHFAVGLHKFQSFVR